MHVRVPADEVILKGGTCTYSVVSHVHAMRPFSKLLSSPQLRFMWLIGVCVVVLSATTGSSKGGSVGVPGENTTSLSASRRHHQSAHHGQDGHLHQGQSKRPPWARRPPSPRSVSLNAYLH